MGGPSTFDKCMFASAEGQPYAIEETLLITENSQDGADDGRQ